MLSTELSKLRRLPEYREPRAHLFPSEGALQWFVRRNRSALVEAGALVVHAGRWHANEEKFDAFVIEAGQEAAQRRTNAVSFAR